MYNPKNLCTLIICHFSQETAASGFVLILEIAFKYKQYSLQAATLSLKGKWEHRLFETNKQTKAAISSMGDFVVFERENA